MVACVQAGCDEGSCSQDQDVTSLVQVNKAVFMGSDRQVPPLVAIRHSEARPALKAPRQQRMFPEAAEIGRADPAEAENVKDAVNEAVLEHEVVADMAKHSDAEHVRAASVLPPPVGHGNVNDNPKVVDMKAVANTMPGIPGGSVVQSFDESRVKAQSMDGKLARDLAHVNREMNDETNLEDQLRKDKEFTTGRYKIAENAVEDTIANKEAVEKAAIHEVEKARKDDVEARIKRNQAQTAAAVGDAYGSAVAYERGKRDLDEKVNKRIQANEAGEELAKKREIAAGITATDDIQRRKESAGRALVDHYRKEGAAERAKIMSDAGIIRTSVEGAEGLKNHMITQAAKDAAADWEHDANNVKAETSHARVGNVGEVRRDVETEMRRGDA